MNGCFLVLGSVVLVAALAALWGWPGALVVLGIAVLLLAAAPERQVG